METIKRSDAKKKGLKRYYTAKACKDGHVAERYVSDGRCVECSRIRALEYYYENQEDRVEYARLNRDAQRAAVTRWREANRDAHRASALRWQKNNRPRCNANFAAYKAAKLQATPPWADLAAIKKIYELAAEISRLTGTPHHVDHIYPLKGETSCGLHIASNLRIISAQENLSKKNKLLPELEQISFI